MAKKANPMTTKNGKKRIKGLTKDQLVQEISKSNRPKDRDKLQRRLNSL